MPIQRPKAKGTATYHLPEISAQVKIEWIITPHFNIASLQGQSYLTKISSFKDELPEK